MSKLISRRNFLKAACAYALTGEVFGEERKPDLSTYRKRLDYVAKTWEYKHVISGVITRLKEKDDPMKLLNNPNEVVFGSMHFMKYPFSLNGLLNCMKSGLRSFKLVKEEFGLYFGPSDFAKDGIVVELGCDETNKTVNYSVCKIASELLMSISFQMRSENSIIFYHDHPPLNLENKKVCPVSVDKEPFFLMFPSTYDIDSDCFKRYSVLGFCDLEKELVGAQLGYTRFSALTPKANKESNLKKYREERISFSEKLPKPDFNPNDYDKMFRFFMKHVEEKKLVEKIERKYNVHLEFKAYL